MPEVFSSLFLGNGQREVERILVVSAYGGITNKLLEHKKSGEPGLYALFAAQADFFRKFEMLTHEMLRINSSLVSLGLDLEASDTFVTNRLESAKRFLRDLASVLATGYVNRRELLQAARELLASIGESHSAFNTYLILKAHGVDVTLADLSGWEDARELSIDERIRDSLCTHPRGEIAVVTGYCKGTEGIMREFDRGYSEVTFSKIAVIVGASEAIIHKEFHLSSADPKLVGEKVATPLGFTNFDVADQLAEIGMEAIHPKASKPLEIGGIDIRVRNAFDLQHPGTLITKNYSNPESKVEIVAGTDKVSSITIHDAQMVGTVGFDLRIMEVFLHHQVSYLCKTTNANTIEMVVRDEDVTSSLIADLREKFQSVEVSLVALVSAVGSNIATPGILAKAATALASSEINVLAISQTSRQTSMQFVIDRAKLNSAIITLHTALCV